MHIQCLGLNHRTALVELRERVALSEDQTRSALTRVSAPWEQSPEQAAEAVILSTCSRTELYVVSPKAGPESLAKWMAKLRGVALDEILPHSYHLTDRAAARHLLRVAAGLDSPILGEPQILGQVARALELSRGQGSAGPILSRLFSTAVHAGKRARSETNIGRNPASAASLAASLAGRSVPDLARTQVVIIGAGKMAELAVEALRKRGVHRLLVVNRTEERARVLSRRWEARVAPFEGLAEAVAAADILITSTGAPERIISAALVDGIMRARPDRPLVAIDIAVPRDIDPQSALVPGVSLYDLDSLNQELEHSLQERTREVPRVEAILAEEEDRFVQHFESLAVLPLVAGLRTRAEKIRRAELSKTLRRMPDLTDSEKERIDALTLALVKKLIDAPITRLRAGSRGPNGAEYVSLARDLYGLSDTQPDTRSVAMNRLAGAEAHRDP